jgi:hypothetical protein
VLSNESNTARRLSDLRARPADATLQNLLAILSAKLDLCGRLPIYEYEADREGHDATAATFHGLLEAERRSFEELVLCLRHYLEATTASSPAGGQPISNATEGTAA